MAESNVPDRYKILASKWKDKSITPDEAKEFAEWYNQGQDNEVNIPLEFAKDLKTLEADMYQNILKRTHHVKRVTLWPRIAVAAAMALAILGAGLFYYAKNTKVAEQLFAYDVAPGKNGATLTLANGNKIFINDALAGDIANQSGVKISKTKDGQIIYDVTGGESENSDKIEYNTLTTTRGEQTQVRLPDGTLVFLNAASSLRYPTRFAGSDKRNVQLSGEGYFEVSKVVAGYELQVEGRGGSSSKYKVASSKPANKGARVPFIVETIGLEGRPGQQVEVLGTHFNISAYRDEIGIRTTLLEGSVRVSQLEEDPQLTTHNSQLLSPGQQSILTANSRIVVKQVDAQDAIAWKEGYFRFNDEPLEEAMKKIARWYNITVEYADESVKTQNVYGSLSRFSNISEVLSLLKLSDVVDFEVNGKKVIVHKK